MAGRGRRPSSPIVTLALAFAVLAGCAAPIAPVATPVRSAPDEVITLPGPEALLPSGVMSATSWVGMQSLPNDFDATATHTEPADLAEAFGAAIMAGWAGSADPPDLALEPFTPSAGETILIVSETGAGDDSVAGSQYALVLVRTEDGWILDQLWSRALCRRGGDAQFCT